jgi:LL-diaminopimelate aminotransferase
LLLVHDNPYADVNWIGLNAPSILQAPGAKEVALELNSLSMLANMSGWRVGMAVGNADAVGALAQLKGHIDNGIFLPLQEAAIAALNLPAEWIADRNGIYKRRRTLVTRALDRMRLWYAPYAATLYVWVEIPPSFADSLSFAETLLAETGVSLAPGVSFGAHGEGFVRISLVQPEDRLEEALERWERWLISKATGIVLDYANL